MWLIGNLSAFGQLPIPKYPQNYFRNPIGMPILLAGNFGECRPNHFHSGIDIKTNGKENYPVYAAATGYISRIKMDKGGFGHAIYITHPAGFTTLYAHLNDFYPALQQFLVEQQYEKENWAVDIALAPDRFPVSKGQQIAWSGNTGSSTAPHLHFEIRDSQTEHPLNPQLFGFHITDTRPPVPSSLAFYDLTKSIYQQTPRIEPLRKAGRDYVLKDTLTFGTPLLGVGILVNDYMNSSNNTLNFLTASWSADDSLQGNIVLDDISYDVTRYMHAYADYGLKAQKGQWYQLLFRLPGNALTQLYPFLNTNRGAISLGTTPRKVTIQLVDASGNKAMVQFFVRMTQPLNEKVNKCSLIQPGKENTYEGTNLKFILKPSALYDSICMAVVKSQDVAAYSDRFLIGDPEVPVHDYFPLSVKPDKIVPFQLRDKLVLKYSDGKSVSATAAGFENGWYTSSRRNFGTYWLEADTISPSITLALPGGANLSKAESLSV
ncbi:MAG: M23 family metallopeptidase, partial [Chitinophagaceae bacterium]